MAELSAVDESSSIGTCGVIVSEVVLSYDRHFKHIPHLKVTDCLY